MAQRRPSKDDSQFAHLDDTDSIAHAMTGRAIEEREWSVTGLLRSLAHKASYKNDAFPHSVIDPELVDTLAQRKTSNATAIIEQASSRTKDHRCFCKPWRWMSCERP